MWMRGAEAAAGRLRLEPPCSYERRLWSSIVHSTVRRGLDRTNGLQTDARQSNRELARTLGVAPSTCLERVRALTRRGVIRGYHAEINPAALNRGVQAMVSVQVRPLSRTVIDTFKDSASAMPEVLSVFVLGGGDDFLLHVAVQDLDHLHAFLLDRLSKRRLPHLGDLPAGARRRPDQTP
jgi:DNA-binding Lrp family transcriptional regulator